MELVMNEEKLFVPDENNTIEYGKRITSLFYKLGFASKEEIKDELEQLILIGNIPYTLRSIGIPAGEIELVPSNIPHMIGRNQEKTEAKFKNMHNLTLQELMEIPSMISDPDMIFRSNTKPNSAIIVCKEVEARGNPIILAMKIHIKDTLDSGGIIVSGYEKDNSPKEFFSNLYSYGYCLYDSEQSEYFNEIKHKDADTSQKQTKSTLIDNYLKQTKEVVAIMQSNPKLSARYERNLSELGYHTLQLKTFSGSEIVSLAKSCTSIVCGKGDIPRFTQMMSRFPQIKKVEEIEAFLPQPIFKNQMPPLSEVINQQKTLGRKSR